MKKRLWVLILCLVMAVSLLPITASAVDYHFNSASIVADGVEYRDIPAEAAGYYVNVTGWTLGHNAGTIVNTDEGFGTLSPIYSTAEASAHLTDPPAERVEYFPSIFIRNDSLLPNNFKYDNDFVANLVIPGYETYFLRCERGDPNVITLRFRMVKHSWQFTQTDSTLTGKCRNNGCPITKVSVELKANSVTLPNSPFNARLEGWEQLVSEFPNAKRKFEYKYKGPGDSEYHPVDPIAANAKAGEYQVGVYLWDITRGPIDPSEGTYLYVKYTAADPAITAQTGDNRPIEIMMVSVLVFSALAAAAFVLDSKRRAQP